MSNPEKAILGWRRTRL